MKRRKLKVREIMLLTEGVVPGKAYAGCMFIVVEPANWGAKGYVQNPPCAPLIYPAGWDEMEPTGGTYSGDLPEEHETLAV